MDGSIFGVYRIHFLRIWICGSPLSISSADHEPCKHLFNVSVEIPDVVTTSNQPKVIFFDTGDGVHSANLCSSADQLDPNVRANLNDRVFIIGELRRRSIWIESDVRRNELLKPLAQLLPSSDVVYLHVPKRREEGAPRQQKSRPGSPT
jgi:hypothetical protein